MRNISMVVSYDGTSYYGFQTQPQRNTIQDKIEDSLYRLTGETIKIISSGRTDAGVHARGQVFNFLSQSPIPLRSWCMAINTRLPRDIVVTGVKEVPLEFHARRWAVRKTYRYTINNSRFVDVFHKSTQFHHPTPLNVGEMEAALALLLGEHDFTSFCSRKSSKQSHIRTIYDACIIKNSSAESAHVLDQPNVFQICISGNGFLYHMVRIIVGTLLEIGQGKRKSEDILEILIARNRSKAGPTAMAHGLVLWDVSYD